MKTSKVSAVLTLIFSLFLCGDSLGFTPLEDKFNEPELNAKRWKLVQSGNARLLYSDGALQFTVGTKASKQENFAYVELRHNQPGYNETWMVHLVACNFAAHGRKTGIGFWIYNPDDPTDAIIFQLNRSPDGPMTARANFFLDDARIKTELKRQVRPFVPCVNLIITFNHKAKLFTFWCGYPATYDSSDGLMNWEWIKVGTFSPTGDRGDARADWKMNAGSGRFGIRLAGFGNDGAVKKGWTSIDYFALKPKIELPD